MDSEKEKMLRGELFHSFSSELVAARARCGHACHIFNTAVDASRVERINLLHDILGKPHIPSDASNEVLEQCAWVEPPFRADYGTNIELGENVFINFNCTILDTCKVTIKSRTLLGPSISLFSATHPIEAHVRNGSKGPELGKDIVIEEDCWLGGNVCVLPGVTIGRGAVVGAGSVVTKDVPANSVVVGNPARVVRTLKPTEGEESQAKRKDDATIESLVKRVEFLEEEIRAIKNTLKRQETNSEC